VGVQVTVIALQKVPQRLAPSGWVRVSILVNRA
jgi:hypothetical protein